VEDTIVPYKYFLTNLSIIINPTFIFLGIVEICQLPMFSNFFQSAMNRMSKSMSRPNIAALGEAFSTVWWVEQMVHAASDRKTLVSLGFTELVILISAVHNMFITTA
jgi:hypothetical protein